MSAPTFRVSDPLVAGAQDWQRWLNRKLRNWGVDYRLEVDGLYGAMTRDVTASIAYGMGFDPAVRMAKGLTPEFRRQLRSGQRNANQWEKYRDREGWRKRYVARFASRDLSSPLAVILSSAWGYGPGHDGVDLISNPNAAGLAICKGRVIRADAGGWWGKGAPANAALRARGDGITIIRCVVNVGPFREGLNFCYGHAENPRVSVGDLVQAGQVICQAGFANAWHFHFMVNDDAGNRGVGDRDPMPYIRFAQGASS